LNGQRRVRLFVIHRSLIAPDPDSGFGRAMRRQFTSHASIFATLVPSIASWFCIIVILIEVIPFIPPLVASLHHGGDGRAFR
jgi:hypothetical protein